MFRMLSCLCAALIFSVAALPRTVRAAIEDMGPYLPGEPPETDEEETELAHADTLRDDDVVVVEEEDDDDEDVRVVEREDGGRYYMRTIATSTIFGALTGLMLGGAFYLLDWPNRDAVNFAYWTGVGALAGAGVGLVQVIVGSAQDDDMGAREPGSPDPAPTWRVPVLRIRY